MYSLNGDFWLSAQEKTAFKDMYCNGNLQTQVKEVQ